MSLYLAHCFASLVALATPGQLLTIDTQVLNADYGWFGLYTDPGVNIFSLFLFWWEYGAHVVVRSHPPSLRESLLFMAVYGGPAGPRSSISLTLISQCECWDDRDMSQLQGLRLAPVCWNLSPVLSHSLTSHAHNRCLDAWVSMNQHTHLSASHVPSLWGEGPAWAVSGSHPVAHCQRDGLVIEVLALPGQEIWVSSLEPVE